MDFFSKKTLGRLIGEFRKKIDLDDNDVSTLKTALDERNYIVHDFFNEMGEALATPEGRCKVLDRAVEARSKMKLGFEILDASAKLLLKLSGVSFEEIQNEVKKKIEI